MYGLQLPYIVHGENIVADSHLIIRYLATTYGLPVKAVVAPGQ
jgi:hypothetical protein